MIDKAYSVGITVSLDLQGRAQWRVAAHSAVDDERFIQHAETLEEASWRVARAIEQALFHKSDEGGE